MGEHGGYFRCASGSYWVACTCGWVCAGRWMNAGDAASDWADHAIAADRTDPTVTAAGGEGAGDE